MPRQSDPSSDSQITVSAELNPLVNPLLAENMGRWAETYFTSPPENREQAVLDLIRQLEAEKAGAVNSPAAQNNTRSQFAAGGSAHGSMPLARCPTCGHENPVSHNFCGMCGASTVEDSGWTGLEATKVRTDLRRDTFDDFSTESSNGGWDSQAYEPSGASTNELSLFQNVPEGNSSYDNGDWAYEPAPSRYRGLIGALLAIVIVALGYLAWRGMQNSRASEVSPAPPAAVRESPAPAAPATTSSAAQPQPSEAANPPEPTKKSAEPPTSVPEPTAKEPERVADNRRSVPTAKPGAAARPTEPVPAQFAKGDGSEELALAQKFLGGMNGQGRDPAEAAKKLWKAIEKHNTQATVLLADLYLKGDGVPKNCDQARVLLYSAARKGVSGAGERLRNLQAFGCQ